MGNILSSINDQMVESQVKENEQWLEQLAEKIKQTPPFGSEIINRRWLEANREKILRNKQLIDLIG